MRSRVWRGSLTLAAVLSGLWCAPAMATAPSGPPPIFPKSVFGIPVTGQPVTQSSPQVVAELAAQYRDHFGTVGINSMPVFVVPASQPRVVVGRDFGCADFEAVTGTVPIPPRAYTSGSGDGELIVDQPSTHTEWELWRASRSVTGAWSACWGGRLDTASSTGVFPSSYGMSATGISYLATIITESDVQSGSIDHAIPLQVPSCHGWTAPAVRGDCRSSTGTLLEGTWLRLPAGLSMPPGLTPLARMVFTALETYGGVVTDRAGAVMTVAESSRDWRFAGHSGTDPITAASLAEPEYEALDGIPWTDLQAVQPPSPPG
ncbi:MAG TPA: hypothetical protein VFP54_13160 [Acidimicrobiales bacterium]|nr:hypothetical protein [Acidimicrobiales bacterium]